ncbi:MAG: PqqD family protein [Actinomycetales bacterium]|nr:PqqD family protein [Candidatus Phosphoribacter baldrii]HRC11312.1 PqqD family protein [Dermatophilaceae bacterium]
MSHHYRLAPNIGRMAAQVAPGLDIVHVAALPNGPILVLEGSAATVWKHAEPGGTAEQIAERVRVVYDKPLHDVLADVRTFLDDLVGRGLLVRIDEVEALC